MGKASCGFSWADEVEKEEREEESRRQEEKISNRKSNPFGSARPREEVLEEKGVDWRKLDQKLDHSSFVRKQQLKENIPVTPPIYIKESLPYRLQNNIQNRNTRKVDEQFMAAAAHQKLQIDSSDDFVPPIMYPPRNMASLMGGMQGHWHSDGFDAGWMDSHHEMHLLEKNMGWQRKYIDSTSSRHDYLDREVTSHRSMANSQNGYTGLVGIIGSVGTSHASGPRKRGGMDDMESEYRRRKQVRERFSNPSVEQQSNGRRCVLLSLNMEKNHKVRTSESCREYFEDKGGQGNYVESHVRDPLIETETVGWRRAHMNFTGQSHGLKGIQRERGVGEGTKGIDSWTMEYGYGRRDFSGGGELPGSTMGSVSETKMAKTVPLNKKKAGFRGKCKNR